MGKVAISEGNRRAHENGLNTCGWSAPLSAGLKLGLTIRIVYVVKWDWKRHDVDVLRLAESDSAEVVFIVKGGVHRNDCRSARGKGNAS